MIRQDAEQIVGPERRLRALHHHWSGEACLISRRPVNSTVRAHRGVRTASGSDPIINSTCVFDPIATAPGSDTTTRRATPYSQKTSSALQSGALEQFVGRERNQIVS
jgi:hypothetical protein